MRNVIAIAASLSLCATMAIAQERDPSDAVEPQAYAGLWYEIARTPAPFEQKCDGGVTAQYEIEGDGAIGVLNRCDLPGGEVSSIEGTAEALEERFRQLKVTFPESPEDEGPGANYVISAVGMQQDGQYPWAVVRGPGEGIGWILSRTPELSPEMRKAAEAALEEAGIDLDRLKETAQPPQNYDPAEG